MSSKTWSQKDWSETEEGTKNRVFDTTKVTGDLLADTGALTGEKMGSCLGFMVHKDLTQPLSVTLSTCAARSFYSLNLLLYTFNVINLLCLIYSNQSYFFCLLWQLICKVCEAARFCRSPLIIGGDCVRLFSVICIFRLYLGSCLVFGGFFTSYYHLLYCFHLSSSHLNLGLQGCMA